MSFRLPILLLFLTLPADWAVAAQDVWKGVERIGRPWGPSTRQTLARRTSARSSSIAARAALAFFSHTAPPHEAGPRAKAATAKALELDSTLAEVHYGLAVVRGGTDWDWERADAEFRRALEINPNYAEARASYSLRLMIMRRLEEAMAQIEQALELDPHNPLFQTFYGLDLEFVRRYDDAIVQYCNALRAKPNLTFAQWSLFRAFHQKQMYAEALEVGKAYFAALGDHEVAEALESWLRAGRVPGGDAPGGGDAGSTLTHNLCTAL